MPSSHARRRDALRSRLRGLDVDALLVTDLRNLRYLSGYTGSNGALLLDADGEDGTVFCTDGRYTLQAEYEVPDLRRVNERVCDIALLTGAADGLRVGFESHVVTVDRHAVLLDSAQARPLVPLSGLVEELRAVKDDDEIAVLAKACAVADVALARLLAGGGIRAGRTERDVAIELESLMVAEGADGPSFETIVAAGANTAVPHHRPSDTELCRGDLVYLDFGALVEGYHSDMTRTFVIGEPADWQREVYELVASAQSAGCAALVPGTDVVEIDAAARTIVDAGGRGAEFTHGLGHGVGLQIHEAPALSARGVGTLAANMVVTVEPGVYLPGRGGVRIEDTLVVRHGAPEVLTRTTKDLVVV